MAKRPKNPKLTRRAIIPIDYKYWTGIEQKAGFLDQWNTRDIRRMMEHPLWRASLRLAIYPLISAKVTVEGDDERQKKFLREWFQTCYRRIVKKMLRTAFKWGYVAGEKHYAEHEGYWWVRDVMTPEDTRLVFDTARARLRGFEYGTYPEVPAEKMAYYAREGDELCQPEGVPLPVEAWWAWKRLRPMYGLWFTWLHRKAIPATKFYYPSEPIEDESGDYREKHEPEAQSMAQRAKDYAAFLLPQKEVVDDSGKISMLRTWDVEELESADRRALFIESLTHMENLALVGMLIPEKAIRQEQAIGSYALSKTQRDMFHMVEEEYLKDWEQSLRDWIVGPMLDLNFSRRAVDFRLGPISDEMLALELGLVEEAIRLGQEPSWMLRWDELMRKLGLPVREEGAPGPRAPTAEDDARKVEAEGTVYFQAPRRRPRDLVDPRVRRFADRYTLALGKQLRGIQERAYAAVKEGVLKEGARQALRTEAVFSRRVPTKPELEKLVQVARKPFLAVQPYLEEAWRTGAQHAARAGNFGEPPREPSAWAKRELRKSLLYFAGSDLLAGEPEMMERRLYDALLDLDVPNGKDASRRVMDTYEAYADGVLKNRVADLIHRAALVGTKEFIEVNRERVLREKAA